MSTLDNISNILHYLTVTCSLRSVFMANSGILFYFAAISTMAAGILHLLMIGPELKPDNFPMEILPYTDGLFIIAGVTQIFWCIPMLLRMGTKWYIIGLIGNVCLTILLIITRVPNGITGTPLEDKNPMALLTEISQFVFIVATILIIINEKKRNTPSDKKNHSSLTGMLRTKNLLQTKYEEPKYYLNKENTFICKDIHQGSNICTLKQPDTTFWVKRGVALRKLGDYTEAIASFSEAIRLNPTDSVLWYQKGTLLNKVGRRSEAINIYEIAKSMSTKSKSNT